MNAVVDDQLLAAWDDPVSASQATFRSVLKALSEPGKVQMLPIEVPAPQPLEAATTALCLALADFETPVWLDPAADVGAVAAYLRFHCGCPLTADAAQAVFAVITDAEHLDFAKFAQGTMEYPDRSTTLLVQVPTLTDGPSLILSGPGIRNTCKLRVGGLTEDFSRRWRHNAAGFPLGVDIVFCCGNRIVGLPRTSNVVEHSSCM